MRFLPIVTSLFFFSSRRRHTRWPRDWSSDVCSSDLGVDLEGEIPLPDLSEFQTRKEFNEWKELQSSFTNRANTEYQRSEERRVGKECRTRREPAYDKKKRNRKE